MIAAAKSPLFLFGRGSRQQDAWDRRVALVEHAGAAVLTSIRERSVFPTDHPQHAVPPSYWLSPKAKDVVKGSDLIVSFDWVDLNGFFLQISRKTADTAAKIAHVSLDQALHNGWSMDYFSLPPVDLPITADPDVLIAQLLPVLQKRFGKRPAARSNGKSTMSPAEYSANSAREIMPRDVEVALQLARAIRKFSLAHTDDRLGGDVYAFRDPLDFLGHDGGAGLAAGPGITVGVSLAMKDSGRPVVSVLGDGDFMQGVSALWTAAHYQLPALYIVSNNRSNFNDELHQEAVAKIRSRPVENRWIGQRIDDPQLDFAGLARAQGVEAKVRSRTCRISKRDPARAEDRRGRAAVSDRCACRAGLRNAAAGARRIGRSAPTSSSPVPRAIAAAVRARPRQPPASTSAGLRRSACRVCLKQPGP